MKDYKVMQITSKIRHQDGATLIEILVAVLVLSIGMLGMVSLQARAMQFNTSSLHQSQANTMAYNIIDLMRANSGDNGAVAFYLHGIGDAPNSTPISCIGPAVTCTPRELAEYDLHTWLNELAILLPSGLGEISVDNSGASSIYTITIQYDDSRAEKSSKYGQDNSNTIAARQITFRTEL